MKVRLYALAALLGLASASNVMGQAQVGNLPKTGLAGSTHDIGGNACKSCHAPHNGAQASGGLQSTGLIMLWSKSFPGASSTVGFGVYDSATMGNKAAELGGAALTTSSDVRMYSLLCLSCHDGVTSSATNGGASRTVNMVGSKAAFGAGAYESLGLTNDHPVNLAYDPTKSLSDSLQPLATVMKTLPLYGSTNTLQCSTCHDPHSDVNTNYLRQVNNTTHCLTCHV